MRAVAISFAALSAACGPSTYVDPPLDTGAPDVADATFEFDSGIPRCGSGPWVVYSTKIYRAWGDRGPFSGIRFGVDVCPELSTVTDEHGFAAIATPRGVPYSILTSHPLLGNVSMQQRNGLWSIFEERAFFEPDGSTTSLDPAKAFVRAMPFADPMTPAPCNDRLGLRARVREFPDAKVRYLVDGVDVDPSDPRGPDILIEGLPGGVDVTVEAEMPACRTRVNPFAGDTGKVRTRVGWLVQANIAILPPLDASDAGDGG